MFNFEEIMLLNSFLEEDQSILKEKLIKKISNASNESEDEELKEIADIVVEKLNGIQEKQYKEIVEAYPLDMF